MGSDQQSQCTSRCLARRTYCAIAYGRPERVAIRLEPPSPANQQNVNASMHTPAALPVLGRSRQTNRDSPRPPRIRVKCKPRPSSLALSCQHSRPGSSPRPQACAQCARQTWHIYDIARMSTGGGHCRQPGRTVGPAPAPHPYPASRPPNAESPSPRPFQNIPIVPRPTTLPRAYCAVRPDASPLAGHRSSSATTPALIFDASRSIVPPTKGADAKGEQKCWISDKYSLNFTAKT
ncbi:hypothetical protein C8Q79DRAFT_970543 [Trametes meyenii]|nr:hypothetical protein C8Q79DRAFT_970543 [Trametes meyenii]